MNCENITGGTCTGCKKFVYLLDFAHKIEWKKGSRFGQTISLVCPHCSNDKFYLVENISDERI